MQQFVKVPNNLAVDSELNLLDTLVYATLKKFVNSETKEAWPSSKKLSELTGLSKPTVLNALQRLTDLQYVYKRTEGRKNFYTFNDQKGFEPISYDFLEMKELTPTEKAVQIRMQHLQFLEGEENVCKMSESEISSIINVPKSTLGNTLASMEKKGFLERKPVLTSKGVIVQGKYFKLNALQQAIVIELTNQNKRITETELTLNKAIQRIEALEKELLQNKYKDAKIIL